MGHFSVAVTGKYSIKSGFSGGSLQNMKGNIFRFVDDRYRSVFLNTDEGVLITDPLNGTAAEWLKKELKRRFDKPVRYVVFSHNHSDHIFGAKVFDDPQTTIVSHELAKQDILNTKANTVTPDVTFNKEMVISLGGHQVELR